MSSVPTLVVVAFFAAAAVGCIWLWWFTDKRFGEDGSPKPPVTSGDEAPTSVRPVLPGAAPTTSGAAPASNPAKSNHVVSGSEQVAAATHASGKPHPHLDTVLTAAKKLPVAVDHDIQAAFDDISPVWGAEEIVVLDTDQLRQRVNKILWDDSASGFTVNGVGTRLDETPPHVQLSMGATDSGPHIAGRPAWRPYRIAKRKDGKYALYGHEAMYRRTRGSDSTEHPVFGLHAGMARASVLDRLGPPTRFITMDEALSKLKSVVGAPPPNREYWLYADTPPGHETRVIITSYGQLEKAEVYVQSSGTSKRIWSTDGERSAATAPPAPPADQNLSSAMPVMLQISEGHKVATAPGLGVRSCFECDKMWNSYLGELEDSGRLGKHLAAGGDCQVYTSWEEIMGLTCHGCRGSLCLDHLPPRTGTTGGARQLHDYVCPYCNDRRFGTA